MSAIGAHVSARRRAIIAEAEQSITTAETLVLRSKIATAEAQSPLFPSNKSLHALGRRYSMFELRETRGTDET